MSDTSTATYAKIMVYASVRDDLSVRYAAAAILPPCACISLALFSFFFLFLASASSYASIRVFAVEWSIGPRCDEHGLQ